MNTPTTHTLRLAGIMVLMAACTHQAPQQEKAPIRVRTEVATKDRPDAATREYVGIIEEAQATAVSFTAMGTVRRVHVSEGQTVGRGQLLAEMDDTQAHHLLEGSQAAVRQAEDALERYRLLHERGSLTEAQWVEVQSKVDQARAQLAAAHKNVADCRLVAPVAGIIGRKAVASGETALPSQAVVTILDISSVRIKFSVPETEMATITPSTPTRISVEAIGRSYDGGRIEKGVQADALTHTYDVRVSVANADRAMLPGMVATVSLQPQAGPHNATAQRQCTVPLTAVQSRVDGTLFVWTVGADSTAHRADVTIGRTQGNRIAITSGIPDATRIVTEGFQKLSEGTRVTF
ncbi:MAG: efflux RND transporter periplasmic adaptor subunit [Bacteroidaceae bacterium]|nr:efflux RND transporter periplasmic adaptor subunit [Bacteroidaceae bacterium]